MHSNLPGLIRVPVFGAMILFSLIVLAIDGHLISKLSYSFSDFGYSYSISAPSWTKLGVAVSLLTFASCIPMLVIDFMRQGAPTSMIAVELGSLGFLWIMWLATAADTASNVQCSTVVAGVVGNSICSEAQAAEAFSFLAWFTLMGYWGLLLVSAIIAMNNGNSGVWMSSVSTANFSGAAKPAVGGNGGQMYAAGPGYGAQQPYYGAPQQQMATAYPPQSNV